MTNEPDETSQEEAAAQLISLAQAAELSGFSAGYIRRLVSRGVIWGIKIGRNWVTTEEAVRAYLATHRQPGPKPKE